MCVCVCVCVLAWRVFVNVVLGVKVQTDVINLLNYLGEVT